MPTNRSIILMMTTIKVIRIPIPDKKTSSILQHMPYSSLPRPTQLPNQ